MSLVEEAEVAQDEIDDLIENIHELGTELVKKVEDFKARINNTLQGSVPHNRLQASSSVSKSGGIQHLTKEPSARSSNRTGH